MGSIPVITFGEVSLAKIVSDGRPVIMRDCNLLNSWDAMTLWDEQYFIENVDSLSGVYVNAGNNTVFRFYDPVRPMHALPPPLGGRETAYYEQTDMSPQDFFAAADDLSQHYYYTGHLEWLPEHVQRTIGDRQPFVTRESSDPVTNVWLGHRGVKSTTHYDVEDNFFVQVKGRKRFTVWSPSQWEFMYSHPRLHPEMRQSQADFSFLDEEAFPMGAEATGAVGVLSPGDVLYLPPYWWHSVVTLEDAVAVNVWTKSRQFHVFNSVFDNMKVPFSNEIDLKLKVLCLKTFITHVLDQALPTDPLITWGSGGFVRAVVASRFARFLPSLEENSSADYADLCSSLGDLGTGVAEQVASRVAPEASAVASQLQHRHVGEALPVLLADWMEEVLGWYLGPNDAGLLLAHCFPA